MHIKENPISKNNKFAGFELDASKIELHSTHKREIRLLYSGPLPDALQKNDGVYIFVNLIVGLKIGIFLVVKDGKKDRHYSIEATFHVRTPCFLATAVKSCSAKERISNL